jgi:hypothetical protein
MPQESASAVEQGAREWAAGASAGLRSARRAHLFDGAASNNTTGESNYNPLMLPCHAQIRRNDAGASAVAGDGRPPSDEALWVVEDPYQATLDAVCIPVASM